MAIPLAPADIEFLQTVRDLGLSGKSQPELAAALGVSLSTLRARLGRLGFELVPSNDIRASLERISFSEMLASGRLVADASVPPRLETVDAA
jgi:hypothetical protein